MAALPNLFAVDHPDDGERFDELARLGHVVVERIASSAHPDPSPYDQAHDEWVVLLRGSATLELNGEPLDLRPGDHLTIAAHTPHRVLRTSADALWLAVHVHPSQPTSP